MIALTLLVGGFCVLKLTKIKEKKQGDGRIESESLRSVGSLKEVGLQRSSDFHTARYKTAV